ncbi:MAG: hypothetical protein IBJ09_15315 [Bacteroidia bacterium]|nr:hypothetical protein [Bacteroidia bacterium]
MKKMYTLLLLSCLFSLPLFSATGYLRYSIGYSGRDAQNYKLMVYPRQIELFFSDEATAIRTSGGLLSSALGTSVWFNSRPDTLYMVSHSNKTIFLYDSPPSDILGFSAKKTGRTLQVAGYEASEYEVSYLTNGNLIKQRVWSSSALRYDNISDMFRPDPLVSLTQLFNRPSLGFPLKVEYEEAKDDMQFTVTITLVEEKWVVPDKNIFVLPAAYTRKLVAPGDPIQLKVGKKK